MFSQLCFFGFQHAGVLAQAEPAPVSIAWFPLVFRLLHILSAITLVGGLIYLRFVLLPGGKAIAAGQLDELHAVTRRRWAKMVAVCVALLLLSGLYTTAITAMQFKLPMLYNILLLVKILLALFVFFIASLLAGKTALAERIRGRNDFWLSLTTAAAVLLVIIASTMSKIDKPIKPKKEADLACLAGSSRATNLSMACPRCRLKIVQEITPVFSTPSPCPLPKGARGVKEVISWTILNRSRLAPHHPPGNLA